MPLRPASVRLRGFVHRREAQVDASLSALLGVQAVTLFVAIPLGAQHPAAHLLLDACHLLFAAICVVALARRRAVRAGLIAALALLGVGPLAGDRAAGWAGLEPDQVHEAVALTAFAFNAAVTALIARHVFAPGRVTAHRVQGAVLLYLNVAGLCAIAFGVLLDHAPGALVAAGGAALPARFAERSAALTYFSLSTLTTTGFGDVTPLHPLARSLANLEAVFGQLFPATLLARLVALHVQHTPPPAT